MTTLALFHPLLQMPAGAELPPDRVARVLRLVFGLPPRVVLPAAALLAAIAVAVLVVALRRRAAIRAWLGARWQRRAWKAGLVGGTLAIALGASFAGVRSYNYIQHDADFCVSCHLMNPAFGRFQQSEHSSLTCHDCHKQSMYANVRQLAIWFTTRPSEVAGHPKLANERCLACHVKGDPTLWPSIAKSAGHRRHLESTDSTLRGLQCVRCHATKLHEFAATQASCTQSGCHDKQQVKLGSMALLDVRCVACHDFVRPVARTLSRDSLKTALWPHKEQCLACHPMRTRLTALGADEPHGALCGTCHNPHEHGRSEDAKASCTRSGCHEDAASLTPLHRGLRSETLRDCTGCHKAHEFKVQSADCRSCHTSAPKRSATTRFAAAGWAGRFSHAPHARLECASCHDDSAGHGALRLRSASDCASCHHRSAASSSCASCHSAADLRGRTVAVRQSFRIADRAPVNRALAFEHRRHIGLQCTACHANPASASGTAPAVDCASCHAAHHTETARCLGCHERPAKAVHDVKVHRGCGGAGCHNDPSLAFASRSVPKSLCIVCHETTPKHKAGAGRRCTDCHDVGKSRAITAARPRSATDSLRAGQESQP